MGTDKVSSLLITMAIPVILSTAVQSLYNVVDGIFVSQISEDAMSAITFANPLVMILIAAGTGIAVGMNTMLSTGLGAGDKKMVGDSTTSSIAILIACSLFSFLSGIFLVKPFMALNTGVASIQAAGTEYLRIYLIFGFATMAQLTFERMLISTGKTSLSMISQATGGLLNILLDYILIFGHFGFPEMGIRGAAAATVFSQFVASIIALLLNLIYNKEISFAKKPNAVTIRRLIVLGLPSAIILSLTSIMIINFNAVLNKFSSTAVAVFGACSRVTGFCYSLTNAMCNATIPIIAYNYGAKNKRRIDETIKYGYLYSCVLMAFCTVICVGFPDFFLRMFHATDDMLSIGVFGMRMLTILYIAVAIRNMSTSILQAMGHSVTAMAIDLSRNYLILIPAAWLLSLIGNVNAIWLSIPVADLVAAIVGIFLMRYYYKKNVRSLSPIH